MTKKMGYSFTQMGDRLKHFEMIEAGREMIPDLPVIARLDGRAFHTFTRGMVRPFDWSMADCMHETTMALVKEFHASVGYTQSDEITLIWKKPHMFGNRFQKYHSVLAGYASAVFAREASKRLPDKNHIVPCFDCRVFQVPDLIVALDVLQWREEDAVKNSIQMAAQAVCSHKELQGKGRKDQLDMLMAKGINWNGYSVPQKRGIYFQRARVTEFLSDAEWNAIPEKHRPASRGVIRGKVLVVTRLLEKTMAELRATVSDEDIYDIVFGKEREDDDSHNEGD